MNYLDYITPKYQSPWGTLKTIPRRLGQKVQYWKNRIFGTHEGELEGIKKLEGEGTDVVSLDQGVLRVTPDTEQRGTLFNEFVENPKNKTIRTASEYKQLQKDKNATVSDRQIPVSNINLFAGIQDGHFVIDSLPNFNDTTTVVPVRNIKKNTPLISSLYLPKQKQQTYSISDEDFKEAQKTIDYYNAFYPDDLRQIEPTKIYYTVKKRLGRKPTFEELQNLSQRLYFNWLLREKYHMPENINELVAPLNDKEKMRLKDMKGLQKELNSQMPVLDRFVYMFQTKNKIPELLYTITNRSFDFLDRQPANNIHNDSILYSLYNSNKKDINKYIAYRKMDKTPKQNAQDRIDDYYEERQKIPFEGLQVITPEGDTIPIGNYNASILDKKMVLGNPKGGMFIADFKNLSQEQLDEQVNPYLKEKPSWLFMPDMGAYSLYGLQNGIDPKMLKRAKEYGFDVNTKPTYSTYWNQFTESESKAPYNPDVHYLVGVKKHGGTLNYLNYIN